MRFDLTVHTKEFLLNNYELAFALAEHDPAFSTNDLSKEFDILSLSNNEGNTVAHALAQHQPEWSKSWVVDRFYILNLANKDCWTVAHQLARYQPNWVKSIAVECSMVLHLNDCFGHSVAHELAISQPDWVNSEAVKSPEILGLKDFAGQSVAMYLAQYQPDYWSQTDAAKLARLRFEPFIHTKEFLFKNPEVALTLSVHYTAFSRSELVKDLEVLSLSGKAGYTVAHVLAEHQPEWLQSAEHQPDWLMSDASKSPEILRLAIDGDHTIAHWLARYQSEWLQSEAATSPEVLRLADKYGRTVAYEILIHQSESVYHQPLMQKQILTLDCFGYMLAEKFTEKYGDTHGLDTSTMAMKLIEQGAAYKHSNPIALDVGDSLLNQCKALIEDNLDAQISLNQLMALHSTFYHNVSKIISAEQQDSLQQWQQLIVKSEVMIRQHLNAYPELYDVEHTVDIFCEPADDLLKRLRSERILNSNLGALNDVNSDKNNECVAVGKGLY
jgi:hypothetical protein